MADSFSEPKIAIGASADQASARNQLTAVQTQVLDLFDLLRNRLLRYLLSFSVTSADAEEIIQEAFLALFQHLQAGKSDENLQGWLFRVVHNLGLRRRRDDRRDLGQLTNSSPQEHLAPDPAPNPEEELSSQQTRARLLAVVDALQEQDRRCLILRAEGLRYREIAAILDMSLSSVSASLSRSLAKIGRAAQW